jgi:hypothetical protein
MEARSVFESRTARPPSCYVGSSWELRECPNGENYIAVQTAILGFLGENRPTDMRS